MPNGAPKCLLRIAGGGDGTGHAQNAPMRDLDSEPDLWYNTNMKVREKWSTARKIWSIGAVVLGGMLSLLFGAFLGGLGGGGVIGQIISGVYQILIFPIWLMAGILFLIFQEPMGNIGSLLPTWLGIILFVVSFLSVPATYFLLVQLVFSVSKKRKLKKNNINGGVSNAQA